MISYYFLLSVVSYSASSDLTHTCCKFKKENHFCFRVTYLLPYSTQETSVEHLGEALQTLVAEQQDLSLRAARSTLSLHRLNQRLVVLERYFIALSRKGLSSGVGEVEGGEEGDKIVELPESKEQFVKEEGRKIKIEGRYVECVCMHVCVCVCVCAYMHVCVWPRS